MQNVNNFRYFKRLIFLRIIKSKI